MKILKYICISTSLFVFLGCSLDEPGTTSTKLTTGDADFSSYVALGNSLTAGYQSGALTSVHQQYSYPNQIATQAGVGTFAQPLLGYPGIGAYTSAGGGILQLQSLTGPVIAPAALADYPSFNPLNPYESASVMTHPAPYNNLGVPGAFTGQLLAATNSVTSGTNNSFFDVILRNINPAFGNTTVLQQAALLNPTFITLWIGHNDVLFYATSGGTQPPAPTATNDFTTYFGGIIATLAPTGADIVVANIADVTSIPYFTTVPYAIDPGVGVEVALFIETAGGIRQATENDFILLTAKAIIGNTSGTYGPAGVPVGFNVAAPLPSSLVLDEVEAAVARNAVQEYNGVISSVAAANDIAVVDFNSFVQNVSENGIYIGGLKFTGALVTGGIFSLDGVHPSDLGYAIIANEWINVINEKFSATIPQVNLLDLMEEISPSINFAKVSYKDNAIKTAARIYSDFK